jgi:hypothetical protein
MLAHTIIERSQVSPKDLLELGDIIEFELAGFTESGPIDTIGCFGYWIKNGKTGGAIRCAFDRARLVRKKIAMTL